MRVLIPLGFFGLFFAWPVVAIISRSLTAGVIRDVLDDQGLRHVAWFTLWQALVATRSHSWSDSPRPTSWRATSSPGVRCSVPS